MSTQLAERDWKIHVELHREHEYRDSAGGVGWIPQRASLGEQGGLQPCARLSLSAHGAATPAHVLAGELCDQWAQTMFTAPWPG